LEYTDHAEFVKWKCIQNLVAKKSYEENHLELKGIEWRTL
jgi:hypothetical protein